MYPQSSRLHYSSQATQRRRDAAEVAFGALSQKLAARVLEHEGKTLMEMGERAMKKEKEFMDMSDNIVKVSTAAGEQFYPSRYSVNRKLAKQTLP